MTAVVRRRPDPLVVLAVATLAGIGTCLLGLAARLALAGLLVPVVITERRHERRQDDD